MRFRRRTREQTRSCRVDVDRSGRLLVMPELDGLAAPPVVVLASGPADAAVGCEPGTVFVSPEYPTEETVAEIAGDWSVNPLTLARIASASGPGLVGHLTEPLG